MYKIKQIKKSKFGYGSKTDEDCILIRICDNSKRVEIRKILYLVKLLKSDSKNILLICNNLENIDLSFISFFTCNGYYVTIQTNGTTLLDYYFRVHLDSIIVIPENENCLIRKCDDLIIKYPKFSEKTAIELGKIDCLKRFISPCMGFNYKGNVSRCIKFMNDNKPWEMSLPTHRLN